MKHTNLFLKGASVSVVALWFLSAEPTFTVTPTEGTDLVKKSKIWISGDATVATTFPKTKNEDSFSGRILYLTGTTPDSGEFTARYEFEVKTNGKFRFFSALTRQGTTYASPVQFRFDQQVFRDVKPNAERVSAWGISKAINWEYLDDLELQSGKHSIEFKTSRKAQNGNWSFMCDGIIGIDTEEQIKGLGPLQVPDQVKPGAELDVVFSSERELFLDIGLLHGPVVVIRKQHRVTIGENKVKLNLPKYMGHGAYRIILSQLGMSEVAISQRSIEVGKPPLANAAAKIESVSVSGTVCSIRLSDDSSALGTRVVGMVFVDGKVYGAQVFEFYKSRILDVPLTSDLVKVVAGRQAEMVFYGCPQVLGNEKKVALSVPGEATPLRKPMNYGVFVDSSKLAHAWYMDHGSRYIYDGVPYIPWGGMWCPNTLFLDQWDDVSIEKALAHDRKTIEALKAKGVVDVYFNQATRAPTWIRQYFVDLMELEGFRYGYQLNGASASSIPSFFITRDQIGLSGWKGLVRGTIEGGKITARFPKSYKILGILAVEDTPVPTWSRFFFLHRSGWKNR